MKTLRDYYENKKPIAYLSTFPGLGILLFAPIDEDICDVVISTWVYPNDEYDRFSKNVVHHTPSGRAYIRKANHRYYLDEFMKI